MTEVVDQPPETLRRDAATRPAPPRRPRPAGADLTEAVCGVLQASGEPLTPAKIRAHLPAALRRLGPEPLAEVLRRQVEAGVLYAYCPYRSQQPRFWGRPLPDHVAALVREALAGGPLTWSQLLRKLPEYAAPRADEALQALLTRGAVHRHPGAARSGERYGLTPPDPRGPLRPELARLFARLSERLGFSEARLRAAALELLQEDEWGRAPVPPPEAAAAEITANEPRYQE